MSNLEEKYAKLLVYKGVNVQKGQPLVIRAQVRDYQFVRKLVKYAYQKGSSQVIVDWSDEETAMDDYLYRTIDNLKEIPDWEIDKTKLEHELGACYLSVRSNTPGLMKDVDPEKINAYNVAYSKKAGNLRAYTMNNIGQWCVAGLPSVGWAKKVFPDLSEKEAFEKLEEAIYLTSRVSEDSDPIENWEKHDQEIQKHNEVLNNYNFKELHFHNSLGTDLHVGLVKDHIWAGGNCISSKGVVFDPNIPTEETFTMPDKYQVNGIVYASKPLSYNGKVIEDFNLTFKDGKVVEFHARKEEETLKKLIEFDEGSCYLGEVALISDDTPVNKTGILFFNTLYDENASCHLALGACYPENLKGGIEMSDEEVARHGGNNSFTHNDFMFGTSDMEVEGITYDGKVVSVFKKGNFVI